MGQGVVPVRVINVTENTFTLRQEMKIGTLSTDVVVGLEAVAFSKQDELEVSGGWSVDTLLMQLGLDQKGLSMGETQAIRDLLAQYASVFSTGDHDLRRTHLTLHQISTRDAKPIKIPPRRVPLHL